MNEFGKDLAEKVVVRLKMGSRIAYSHRDYCGMGIELKDGKFDYGYVQDGDLVQSVLTFNSETAFVSWLSNQSDESLCGMDESNPSMRNNQRITRERLELFISVRT